jgi:hypothetical protein
MIFLEKNMFSKAKYSWTMAAAVLLFSAVLSSGQNYDIDRPEITDRVARISYLRGEVHIRRADTEDWESATLNLPIVEGDEITTAADARFEIQFNSQKFLRVAESSHIKIANLIDEGVAVSVLRGSVAARIFRIDNEDSYFEIDGPLTTIALQKAGHYLIEADPADEGEIRVSVTEGGEARLYSESSGLTLRSGRNARVFISGARAGEWETEAIAHSDNGFGRWSLERDEIIAKRLKNSHYDEYYDRDIYGAEDLGDYGQWVHTRDYGYVWQPHRTSIASYANWSPYRYGNWRWVAPFGWTWVNDEPWGWATYHYGRWIWLNGGWYWTPYAKHRYGRSYWYPALVYMTVFNNNICWYPLPYYYTYYNYNRHYYARNPRRNAPSRPRTGTPPVTTSPTPQVDPGTVARTGGSGQPPSTVVPPGAVVMVPQEIFGQPALARTTPANVARTVLSSAPDVARTPPVLPTIEETRTRGGRVGVAERPIIMADDSTVRTGAVSRSPGRPLDTELQKKHIFGDRTPVRTVPSQTVIRPTDAPGSQPRTGAVERPVTRRDDAGRTPVILPPYVPPAARETKRSEPAAPRTQSPPVRQAPIPRQDAPRYEPPRTQSPPVREAPRPDTPRTSAPPRPAPPKSDSQKPSSPPPAKEPAKPSPSEQRTSKDG